MWEEESEVEKKMRVGFRGWEANTGHATLWDELGALVTKLLLVSLPDKRQDLSRFVGSDILKVHSPLLIAYGI